MRRFRLIRTEDKSGVSGIGAVAEGIQFSNGKCVMSWTTQYASICVYDNVETLIKIHGHNGATNLQWVDEVGAHFGVKEPTFIIKSTQGSKIAEGVIDRDSNVTIYLPNGTYVYASSSDAWIGLLSMFGDGFTVEPVRDYYP